MAKKQRVELKITYKEKKDGTTSEPRLKVKVSGKKARAHVEGILWALAAAAAEVRAAAVEDENTPVDDETVQAWAGTLYDCMLDPEGAEECECGGEHECDGECECGGEHECHCGEEAEDAEEETADEAEEKTEE